MSYEEDLELRKNFLSRERKEVLLRLKGIEKSFQEKTLHQIIVYTEMHTDYKRVWPEDPYLLGKKEVIQIALSFLSEKLRLKQMETDINLAKKQLHKIKKKEKSNAE